MAEGQNTMRVTTCPSNSFWFECFMWGYHERVGDLVKQNLGICFSIMVELMEKITDMQEQNLDNVKMVELAFYCMICYLGALHGNKGFWFSLGECLHLCEATASNSEHPHVVIPLQGNFKLCTGLFCFLLFLSTQVSCRFKYTTECWLHMLMGMRKSSGATTSWLFAQRALKRVKGSNPLILKRMCLHFYYRSRKRDLIWSLQV